MYERIVVPLDGTPFGEFAIRYATAVAHHSGASLDLVHVHIPAHLEPELFETPAFHYRGIIQSDAELEHEHLLLERERLERRAGALAKETGLSVTGRVVVGTVDRGVEYEAEAFGADLIVMSTHARTGLDRVRFGSVGDAIVRHATVPVLLVHPPENGTGEDSPTEFRHLLVPLDGSEFSEQVLDSAGQLAQVFDARLHLVYVQVPASDGTFRRDIHDDDGRPVTLQFSAQEYLQYVATEYAGEIEEPLLEVRTAQSVIGGILEAATTAGADLIAMATHGRGGLKRMLLGSTAGDVLCNAGVPVLLFRPQHRGMFSTTAGSMGAGHTVV